MVFIETKERIPRDFCIGKKDTEMFGYTRGCGGCSSWSRGLSRQPHTEECRASFRDFMRDAAKVKSQEIRMKELEDRELNKRTKKDGQEEREVESEEI